jgi:hypothetical protein
MRIRIRIPGLDAGAHHALSRKARLVLGRHAPSIQSVELAVRETERASVRDAECEVVVTLREGGPICVHDDGSQIDRALLRAAWRIDQRRELQRSRGSATGASFDPL